jgi:hypothetical protein
VAGGRVVKKVFLAAGGWPGLIGLLLFHWRLLSATVAVLLALGYALAHLLAARSAGRASRFDYALAAYLGLLLIGLIVRAETLRPLLLDYFFFGLYSALFLAAAAPLWLDLTLTGPEPGQARPRPAESTRLAGLWAGVFLASAGSSLGPGLAFKVGLPVVLLLVGWLLAGRIKGTNVPRPKARPRRPEPAPASQEGPEVSLIAPPAPRLGPIKEVLVIQGSPRDRAGLTEKMLQPLLAGLDKEQVPVDVVRLAELNLRPCLSCFDCWTKKPGVCVLRDDMEPLLRKLTTTDLVLLAGPQAFGGFSTLTKVFIDRCAPLLEPWLVAHPEGGTYRPPREGTLFGRRLGLLALGSLPQARSFQSLLDQAGQLANLGGGPLVARLVIPGAEVLYLGARLGPAWQFLEEALYRAGLELARQGRVDPATEEAIRQPLFRDEVAFRLVVNLYWETCQEYHAARRAGLDLPDLETFIDQDVRLNLGGLTLRFEPEKMKPAEATYQFSLAGRQPGQWYLKIKGGRCGFHEGWAKEADLVISTASEVWVAVVKGEVELGQAVRESLIRLEGSTELLGSLSLAFGWARREAGG